MELNSKYEGLNFEDLNNFKSDASVQQWEGEDFRGVSLHESRLFVFPRRMLTTICSCPAEKISQLQSPQLVEA